MRKEVCNYLNWRQIEGGSWGVPSRFLKSRVNTVSKSSWISWVNILEDNCLWGGCERRHSFPLSFKVASFHPLETWVCREVVRCRSTKARQPKPRFDSSIRSYYFITWWPLSWLIPWTTGIGSEMYCAAGLRWWFSRSTGGASGGPWGVLKEALKDAQCVRSC